MNWGAVWLIAGAVALGASSANAQYLLRGPGVIVASDFDAPYDDGGLQPLPPRYAPSPYSDGPRYAPPPYAGDGYGPSAYATPMLPPGEIVRIARQNGFSPLGDPQQRGFIYRIAVISPDGDDGRLVIDARTGRILRFVPASEYGSRFDRGRAYASAPVAAVPPMAAGPRASLRPQASVAPRLAAPTALAALPKASPAAPAAAPRRQADVRSAIPPAPPAALANVAPAQLPVAAAPAAKPATDMPPAQGLD